MPMEKNALFMTILACVSSLKPSTGMKLNVLCVHDRYDRIDICGEVPTLVYFNFSLKKMKKHLHLHRMLIAVDD